jgi:hypothetical protein
MNCQEGRIQISLYRTNAAWTPVPPLRDRNGRRAKIEANSARAYLVLRFLVGNAFQSQLHAIPIAFTIRSLGLWRACATTQQTHKLDRVIQPMLDHGIIPVKATSFTLKPDLHGLP